MGRRQPVIVTIQLRRGTAASWASANTVLHQGEVGVETDTGRAKLGDGATAWTSLGYWNPLDGDSTSDKNYTQEFITQSTVSVGHNLGKLPAVTVLDSAGDEVEGDVQLLDLNNLTVSFSAPFSGTVTCN